MDHRCAPGRIPGRFVTGCVTFLAGLCLSVAAVAAASPARADIGPVPVAGELSVETSPPSSPGVFAAQRLGKTSQPQTFRYRNTGLIPVTIGDVTLDPPRQPNSPLPAPPAPTPPVAPPAVPPVAPPAEPPAPVVTPEL